MLTCQFDSNNMIVIHIWQGPLKLCQLNKDQLTEITPLSTVDVSHSLAGCPPYSPSILLLANQTQASDPAQLETFGPSNHSLVSRGAF